MVSSTQVLPVIMSGGSGTRLWPLSTEDRPKQFHALASQESMIQDTARRVSPGADIDFLSPLVICNGRHADLVMRQLTHIGVAPAAVILEPFARNTASVSVVAAAWARDHAPGALLLLLPADHVVADRAGFRDAVVRALPAARERIVTFGIQPTGPETGYGYIQAGDPLAPGIFAVARFVEKPSRLVAEAYLAEGGYSWNAGIFLYDPLMFLKEASRLAPAVAEAALAALTDAVKDGAVIRLDDTAFARCPSTPIDVAVMEKTDHAAIVPCSVGWADVGSWSELWRQGERDAAQNLVSGEVVSLDATGSLFWSDGPRIAAIGVRDLVIIAAGGHVLVAPMDRAQDVKAIVEALKGGK